MSKETVKCVLLLISLNFHLSTAMILIMFLLIRGKVRTQYIHNKILYTVEHGYNEFFYNEFMVITNLSLHPVVISVFHCSSFITKIMVIMNSMLGN